MTQLFDFSAARRAAGRAQRLGGDRFLCRAAAEGLAERLAAVKRRFVQGLWIGAAVPDVLISCAEEWSFAAFDAEDVLSVPPGSFDLALSLYSLQAVNDLPGALIQIRRALKPDGLFLAALLGGGTLQELRDAFAHGESETQGGTSPRISPFGDVRDLGGLLIRTGFALSVTDSERLTVRYGDFFRLARDLRAHGFTNVQSARSRTTLRRDTLTAMLAHYHARHGDSDGKLRASFETIFLTGWSPHESQQKALKPGGAKVRLAEALGVREHPAGEKPSS